MSISNLLKPNNYDIFCHTINGTTPGGGSTFTDITVTDTATINNLDVSGTTTLNGTIATTLNTSGTITSSGGILSTTLSTTGDIDISQDANISGDLHVTGNETVGGTLTIEGGTTLHNSLTTNTISALGQITANQGILTSTLTTSDILYNGIASINMGTPFAMTGTIENCLLLGATSQPINLGSQNRFNVIYIVADALATVDALAIQVATSANQTTGVQMDYGDFSWSAISCSKTTKTPVNDSVDHVKNSKIFESLKIDKWVHKANNAKEHYGPYAEDIKELFNIGTGKTLSTQDLDGVMYTVVKGLTERVKQLEEQVLTLMIK